MLTPEERKRRQKAAVRRWELANKERKARKSREWYLANKAHKVAKAGQWRARQGAEYQQKVAAYAAERHRGRREEFLEKNKIYRQLNVRKLQVKRHGLTLVSYELMWKRQCGLCALCAAVLIQGKTTHIDHCHETGRIRGLLCRRCNYSIAGVEWLRDSLRDAFAYLDSKFDARSMNNGQEPD